MSSCPLDSFDMEARHELAFRYLQGGLNLGKVVVRVGARRRASWHVITGGTGSLGLLTGRWLAQREHDLVLASRSGALARDTARSDLFKPLTRTLLLRSATQAGQHVRRMVAFAPRLLQGVWHAAGACGRGASQTERGRSRARLRIQGARRMGCMEQL